MIRCPGRKTPAARSGRFAFRCRSPAAFVASAVIAPPRRHEEPAPPQLRSVARATVTLSAPVESFQNRSGARPAAPPTGLVESVGFGFPGHGRPSAWPHPRAVEEFSAPLLGTSKAFHPVGRAHFKVSCPTSATVMYFRPRGQIYVSEVPGAYLQSRAQPCFQGTAHSAVAPRAWARSLPKPRRHTSPPPRLSPEKVSLPGVTKLPCFTMASASAAPLRRRAGHTPARPTPLAVLPGYPAPPPPNPGQLRAGFGGFMGGCLAGCPPHPPGTPT